MKKVVIIGGGAASFVAADQLSKHFEVCVYEKGKSVGKKFLVAGKGGFNLAHNLSLPELSSLYSPKGFMDNCLESFDSNHLRNWYSHLGISTFIGSSNRIFPEKGISPANVLNTIKSKLHKQGVTFFTEHEFIGFSKSVKPLLKNVTEELEITADYYIFALGGGSWKVTGANSKWLPLFENIGIPTLPFQSSNCGLNIEWPTQILNHHVGKPLKNISVSINNNHIKGEALITTYGLEGNAIYPISSWVRDALKTDKNPQIAIDFKPNNTEIQLLAKLKHASPKNYGKLLHLDSVQMAFIKSFCTKEEYLNPTHFVGKVKNILVTIQSLRGVEESISTVGGIPTSELNADFSLHKYPHVFCIGEMVDWDAPTGGFLLQGCFSMSNYVAQNILERNSV